MALVTVKNCLTPNTFQSTSSFFLVLKLLPFLKFRSFSSVCKYKVCNQLFSVGLQQVRHRSTKIQISQLFQVYHAKHITVVRTYSGVKDTVAAQRSAARLSWISRSQNIKSQTVEQPMYTDRNICTTRVPTSSHPSSKFADTKFPLIRQISAGFLIIFGLHISSCPYSLGSQGGGQ